MNEIVRFVVAQGDVLLEQITKDEYDQLISTANRRGYEIKKTAGNVLARGEQTGHNHVIKGEATVKEWIDPNRSRDASIPVMVVHVAQEAELIHTSDPVEHEAITLPDGFYVVRRQSEYRERQTWSTVKD